METMRFNLESEQVESTAGKAETMILSMGPQHPSTHGVLRVVLELDGETVIKARPDIGYLHTGMEKLSETKTYAQVLPITDRTDYLAPMSNNLGYIMAVEKLCGIQNEIPPRAQYVRVIMVELNRIASHLVWLGTHAMDIGAMTVFLYCFREREQILNFFEAACGGRLTTSYFRVGGLPSEIPADLVPRIQKFIKEFPDRVQRRDDGGPKRLEAAGKARLRQGGRIPWNDLAIDDGFSHFGHLLFQRDHRLRGNGEVLTR